MSISLAYLLTMMLGVSSLTFLEDMYTSDMLAIFSKSNYSTIHTTLVTSLSNRVSSLNFLLENTIGILEEDSEHVLALSNYPLELQLSDSVNEDLVYTERYVEERSTLIKELITLEEDRLKSIYSDKTISVYRVIATGEELVMLRGLGYALARDLPQVVNSNVSMSQIVVFKTLYRDR